MALGDKSKLEWATARLAQAHELVNWCTLVLINQASEADWTRMIAFLDNVCSDGAPHNRTGVDNKPWPSECTKCKRALP